MIYSYCKRGIYNNYTSQRLEEGDFVRQLSYWNGDSMKVITTVWLLSVSENEIVFEARGQNISISIEDIEDWD